MMTPMVWAILLMVLGVGLLVLEMFIPSGGVLSFLALTACLSAISLAYYHFGPRTGTLFFAFAVVVVPVIIAGAIRWWPTTPLGRMVVLHPPGDEEILADDENTRWLQGLLGKRGKAKTPLLPAGAVLIEGRTVDAVSQGEAIDAGQPIEVVQVDGNHVVVRIAVGAAPTAMGEEGDVLAQPIEAVGPDPFEDPLL